MKQVRGVDRIINVLFVDDDSSFLDSTKMLLERLGYIVTSANGSREALALMKEYHDVFNDAFDLIITDYYMPDMNGIEFARTAGEFLVGTPIILYTGKADLIDKGQLAEAGIALMVSKPCTAKELDLIIRNVIKKNKKEALW